METQPKIGIAHLYWLSQESWRDHTTGKMDEVSLSRFGLVMAIGLTHMLQTGYLDSVVMITGSPWGEGTENDPYPSVAGLTRDSMLMFGVPEGKMIVKPSAVDTFGETVEALAIIDSQFADASQIIEVCGSTDHKKPIELIQAKKNWDMPVIAMETYLQELESDKVNDLALAGLHVLRRMRRMHRFNHRVYEGSKRLALKRWSPEDLRAFATNTRKTKGSNTPRPFAIFQTDGYKLGRRWL